MFIVAKQTENIFEDHQYHISAIFEIHFLGKEPEVEAKGDLESVEKSFPAMVIFFLPLINKAACHFLGLICWFTCMKKKSDLICRFADCAVCRTN